MKEYRTSLVRIRQVSLKAPWISVDTVRAPFKQQKDPFPSDDWYFTFHTTPLYLLLNTTMKLIASISCLPRNAGIKAFVPEIQIIENLLLNA